MIKFISGIMFAYLALPILDSCGSLITTWIESLKGNSTLKIAKYNKSVNELEDIKTTKSVIGFAIPDIQDEDDETECI